MLDRLTKYRAKRDFKKTAEPAGARKPARKGRSYLIQKHAAGRLHYDFRLEHNGVLLSWAIPKGPSLDPGDKRLAVHVEDHPLEYGAFEGTIPKGQYGGGTVMLWDRGSWEPHGDADAGLKEGKLKFTLYGKRLKGDWALIRLRGRPGERGDNWLLIKEKDDEVRVGDKPLVHREMTSIATGRTMEGIAQGNDIWRSKPAGKKGNARKSGRAASGAKKKSGAVKLPPFVPPQLATLVDAPPASGDWVHEIKYDGYRAVTSIAGGSVVIRTRNGLDWTDRFQSLVAPLAALSCDSALLDGEIAVSDSEGHTSFSALQAALSEGRGTFGYYIFDLLHLDGEDLRKRPLVERKKLLEKLLAGKKGPLFYSSHMAGQGEQIFQHACDLKLEGIISKLARDPYRSGRTKSWLKTKCGMEQEFVIVGWQPSDKAGRPFRSILLAVREENELRYVGRVGSGYTEARLGALSALFKKHARRTPPVENVPRTFAKHARWVEPVLVAQVALRGWTRDGMVRQGSFRGLREDKQAAAIVREVPMRKAEAVKIARSEEGNEIEGVRITHPEREMFAGEGVTKRDIIEYYLAVADRMLPHIENRPLALVRCPDGTAKQCFFQKHASPGWPDLFGKIRIREKSGSDEYLYIGDVQGLIAAAQMSVLELHILGARADAVEKPDRMVFDLDPDEGLPFAKVRSAAKDLRDRLKKIGLESFPLVTGGKGVHVVVPLQRKHTWDQHRAFAEAVARLMADEEPERFVANMAKKKRTGKIFVDYLRNQRGSTAIAPFSTRARKGAFVALPVSWQGLAKLSNAHPADIKSAPRFARGKDPWAGYFKVKQALPLGKNKK